MRKFIVALVALVAVLGLVMTTAPANAAPAKHPNGHHKKHGHKKHGPRNTPRRTPRA